MLKPGRNLAVLISVIPVAAKIVMARQAGSLDKVAAVIELRPGGEDASADSADSPQASNNGDLITHAADAVGDAAQKALGIQ